VYAVQKQNPYDLANAFFSEIREIYSMICSFPRFRLFTRFIP